LAATAAAVASTGLTRGSAASVFSYRYGSNLPPEHPLNVRMEQACRAIADETNGRLRIAVFPNSELGGDTAMLAQLRSGALQFFTLDGGILQAVVPVAAIQGVGFAFRDSAEAFRAMDGSLGAYVRSQIEAQGLRAFPKMWDNGMRQITTSTKPIQTAADLAGLKIRTPAGRLWIDLFKSLGASPTPINFAEVYSSLVTHVVDAQENPFAIVESAKLYEVQKYLSVTNHMWSAYWMLANADAWKALPPEIQAVVARNFEKYALLQRADVERLNDTLAATLVKQGMIMNRADTKSFRGRLGGFYAYWKSQFGEQAWNALESTVGKLG
jgi:tripartite ATP-independent transporter DctP family solute receptor